ncbi:MAG: DUF433 domain-containing protein [Bryobacteraceae bacterium]
MSPTAETPIFTGTGILGGKPVIRGTRLSVDFLLELMATGTTILEIVAAYPAVTKEDVANALLFAAEVVRAPSATDIEAAGNFEGKA